MAWGRELGYGDEAPVFDGLDAVVDPLFRSAGKTGSARRNREAQFSEGSIETMKGRESWSEENLRINDSLSRKLTADIPSSTDEFGRVGENGIRGPFWGLRYIPGLPMIPATYPLADNTKKRADAGLAAGPINEKHELIFRATVRLFFSGLENQGLRIAKDTSTGSPQFLKTMLAKMIIARDALQHAEAAGKLFLQGKYQDAFLLYDYGGCYYVVYREQMSDGMTVDEAGVFTPKQRMVADRDYAVSGGKKGKLFPSNRDPSRLREQGFFVPDGFFCTRRRTAMACPFTINAAIMTVAQAVRARIYDEYAFALHHTTRVNKQEKVNGWDFAIPTDVSDHDTYWPGWLLDLICDELLQIGYADWWVEILRTAMRLPVYVSAPSPDEGRVLIGDWRDPRMNVGLPSGIGITDIMGSLLMVPCYTILQIDHTAEHLWDGIRDLSSACAFMDSYLKGKEEIAQMSKSDDALIGWKRGPSAIKGRALLAKMQEGAKDLSPYMIISYEHGGAFLGDILMFDHTKELSAARFVGNALSYVVNMFCPEYGVDSKQPNREKRARAFPGLAVEAAPLVFGSAPEFDHINEIIEEVHYDHTGESFAAFRREILREDKQALADWIRDRSSYKTLGELSPMDYEVLAEPSKLTWKFDPLIINPAVIEMVSTGLDKLETAPFFNSVMRDVK